MKRSALKSGAALIILIPTLVGCGPGWQPVSAPQPSRYNPRDVVEFQSGKTLVRLHGASVSRDSISGIPWLEHLSCDTCRVSYPLASVTGMRTGHPGMTAWNIILPIAVFMGVGGLLFLNYPRD